jgi:hypothetical protein
VLYIVRREQAILYFMTEFDTRRMELLEERLHDHIEHYLQNNRALSELSRGVAVQGERLESLFGLFNKHIENEEKYQGRIDEHLDKLGVIVSSLNGIDVAKTRDVVDTYRGLSSVRGLVVGLGAVMLALGTIGTGIIWIVKEAIKH